MTFCAAAYSFAQELLQLDGEVPLRHVADLGEKLAGGYQASQSRCGEDADRASEAAAREMICRTAWSRSSPLRACLHSGARAAGEQPPPVTA